MTDDEIRRIAEHAAARAADRVADRAAELGAMKGAKKVFAILGVDIERPAEIENFRQTLRHAEFVRRVSSASIMAAVGGIGVGILAALWAGVQALLKAKGGG